MDQWYDWGDWLISRNEKTCSEVLWPLRWKAFRIIWLGPHILRTCRPFTSLYIRLFYKSQTISVLPVHKPSLQTQHSTLSTALIFSVFPCACIHAYLCSRIICNLSVALKQPPTAGPQRWGPSQWDRMTWMRRALSLQSQWEEETSTWGRGDWRDHRTHSDIRTVPFLHLWGPFTSSTPNLSLWTWINPDMKLDKGFVWG